MVTRQQLAADLRVLGVVPGDRLFVHSSYKSLGPVAGGAEAVIEALGDAVGPCGLVAMPSFHLIERDQRHRRWDPATTPSTVGWLTEVFRTVPGTVRSDHYSHSVAARGAGAAALVADHRRCEGQESPWDLAPWGRTYGAHSPMVRLYRNGGRLLMLGVGYDSSTYAHLVEVMDWHRCRAGDDAAAYRYLNRAALGAFWDASRQLHHGAVAGARCRLFSIADYVDALRTAVEDDPASYTT